MSTALALDRARARQPRGARRASARGRLLALWLVAACGGSPGGSDAATTTTDAGAGDADIVSRDAALDAISPGHYEPQPPVTIPPEPPASDRSGYPTDDQGRPILSQNGSYHLVERQPDPLTAHSDCTAMIVRCVDPAVEGRNLDACAISPPHCATAQPWLEAPCCATACIDRYEQLRTSDVPPITAFRQAFYGRPSCAPGVDALLGGTP